MRRILGGGEAPGFGGLEEPPSSPLGEAKGREDGERGDAVVQLADDLVFAE